MPVGVRCSPPVEKGRVTAAAAVYDLVSLLTALGKARPALSHRQQWANSEPIMSDHCHVPEPTHADIAHDRERHRGRLRARGGWACASGRTSLQVIAQITRDPFYP